MNPVQDIVADVADSTGRDHTDLPPLFDAIDPDVVTAFVESTTTKATLQFVYCDNVVTVEEDGQVETEPLPTTTPPTI